MKSGNNRRPHAANFLLVMAAVALFPYAALAAAATPGAGTILQQVNPKQPPAPSKSTTGLRLERPKEGVSASQIRFVVKRIDITDNTLFATSELHALVAGDEGKQVALGDLQRLAQRITDFYHVHGYSLSRVVIPVQTVKDGVVRFEVVEGRYAKVAVINHSRVRHGLLQSTLSPLKSGDIIADRELDHLLLLLSDIPGVSVEARLKPGAAVASSDLDVTAEPQAPVTGYLSADNFGNQYTGRARVGGGITLYNPLRFGDELTLNGMTSGKGVDYGRAAYDSVVNGYGTQLGVSYSLLHYILGGSLSNLAGYGTAQVEGGWLKQPLIRSRTLNVYGQLQYDYQTLRDHIDSTAIRTDRNTVGWTVSLTGDVRDAFLGGAVSSWRFAWTGGNLSFKDANARAADAATAQTAGRFYKWDGTVTRLQRLLASTTLYVLASGQWTTGNLDSVEKMSLGGPNDVRAYDVGVLSADTGYRGTAELRQGLPAGFQAKVFYDGERMTINHHPWTTGVNTATLEGVGLGLDWSGPEQIQLEGVVAFPVGARPVLLAKRSAERGWVQMSKTF